MTLKAKNTRTLPVSWRGRATRHTAVSPRQPPPDAMRPRSSAEPSRVRRWQDRTQREPRFLPHRRIVAPAAAGHKAAEEQCRAAHRAAMAAG